MRSIRQAGRWGLRLLLLSWWWVAGSAGCRSDSQAGGAGGAVGGAYSVWVTIAMIGDVVREVAGPRAVVQGLIGEGVDPHLYKPTSTDVKRLQGADVIFYNGLMLEGKLTRVLEGVATGGMPVVAVAEKVAAGGGYVIEGDAAHRDPHLWMDVGGWMRVVEVVGEVLSDYDPEHAAGYQARAEVYLESLRELEAYVRRCIATIPSEQRVLVTAHDAFGYFGRAYGVEVRGIQGLTTEAEAGVRDIETLVDFLVQRRIPAVFVESSVSGKNVRALVEGAAAQGHELKIGGELYSDAMGEAGTYEGTYLGMIDHNVTTLTRALGGTAPARGMQGRLGQGEAAR